MAEKRSLPYCLSSSVPYFSVLSRSNSTQAFFLYTFKDYITKERKIVTYARIKGKKCNNSDVRTVTEKVSACPACSTHKFNL